ncbi:MAG TPA: dienelactone hydrolase family protein [Abditibacteriaceae bacterium]|jgi:carboxymethylenebutenolidase
MSAASQNIQQETLSIPATKNQISAVLFSSSEEGEASRRPALVVLHDFYGPDAQTQEAAARLASQGYVVLMPDLFAGKAPQDATGESAFADFTQSLTDTQILAQIIASVDALVERGDVNPSRIGIVGWGWSGCYALMAAAHDDRLRVAADIGGEISYPVLTLRRPGSPLNFVANLQGALFAAFPGNDPLFPRNEIERLMGRLVEHDKIGEVKVYDGAPARFWRDAASPHTVALWRRLESFLKTNFVPLEDRPEKYASELQPDTGYPNEESRIHA